MAVRLGGLDEAIQARARHGPTDRVGEEPVAPADDEGTDSVLGQVVIDLEPPIVEIADKPLPLAVQIAERLAREAFGRGLG